MLEIEGVDYIRVPVQDVERAKEFYGGLLGLQPGPTQHEDWVEYEAANVTLAVMTPHTHDQEFAVMPPGTIALGVPDVAAAKAELEAKGVEVAEMWDSGACHGAGVSDPAGNRILLHHRYGGYMGPRAVRLGRHRQARALGARGAGAACKAKPVHLADHRIAGDPAQGPGDLAG